ncbi:glutathione S-transferase [Aspergillus luchuensis]|uniref:Glutathione S-transferase n=1 Tax=Aspergillus kawachii TaxID=1069201 RepID=A0A146FM38_ASPKA|nr:glutathione S-transferase [Aspergillus luchuensis]
MADPNKGTKITLYWLSQSRSHRILWLLEALHLTYELKIYHRGPDKLAPPELKEIHPLGKSPLLTIQPANAPPDQKPIVEKAFLARNIQSHLEFLEDQLRSSPNGGAYLCGTELTAADIMMSFPVIAMSGRLQDQLDKFPLLAKYAERLQKEEGYIRAVKKVEEVDGKFEASL